MQTEKEEICSLNTNVDYKTVVWFYHDNMDKEHSPMMDTHKYILTEMASLWPLNLWMSWQVSGFHRRTNLFFPPDACNERIMCNNRNGYL